MDDMTTADEDADLAATIRARLADTAPSVPLEDLIDELGFSPSDFEDGGVAQAEYDHDPKPRELLTEAVAPLSVPRLNEQGSIGARGDAAAAEARKARAAAMAAAREAAGPRPAGTTAAETGRAKLGANMDEPDEFVDVEDDCLGRLGESVPVKRPLRQVWLLWDTGDLVGTAAYSSEAAAEVARVAYTKKVRAELAAESQRPARIHTEVTPIDVQD
jgi:hypothetical protein